MLLSIQKYVSICYSVTIVRSIMHACTIHIMLLVCDDIILTVECLGFIAMREGSEESTDITMCGVESSSKLKSPS